MNNINKDLFKKEYLCVFTMSPTYEKAYELWIWYEYNCEIYDKIICNGKEDSEGFIRPADSIENRLIDIHADMIRHIMIDKVNEYNSKHEIKISDQDCVNAKNQKNRLTWKGIQEEYKRIYKTN